MSDLDLDRLGDVWRQQPTAREMADLQRAAETARRRARWAQRVEAAMAVTVALLVVLLVIGNPRPATLAIGAIAIVVVLFSQIRQRRLRQAELNSLAGSSEDMLDQSMERIRQRIKRTRFGMLMIAPGLLLGLLVARAADRSVTDLASAEAVGADVQVFTLAGAVAVIAASLAVMVRGLREARRELERLAALRDTYDAERNSSGEG